MSKIVSLRAENVKRLTAVEITPEGNLVVVGGRNGAGKSSVLDAIMYALGGASTLPAKPVRKGAQGARVELDLGDLVVTRTMTKDGGGSLKVTAADGTPQKSPQAMLDALCGRLAFDPLAFARAKPDEQRETLRRMVGVDTAEIDSRSRALLDERVAIGREVKRLASAVATMPRHDDAPDAEVDPAELAAEEERIRAHNANVAKARAAAEREASAARQAEAVAMAAAVALKAARAGVANAKCALEEAERAETAAAWAAVRARTTADKVQADAAALPELDAGPLRARLVEASRVNEAVRGKRARAKAIDEHRAAERAYAEHTRQIERCMEERRAAIEGAQYPLPGLSLGDDGVLLDAMPFEQASSAQQLRASVAIGLKLNPKLRVLLVRDGSLLDPDGLRAIADMAAEADAQVWIERVGSGEEVSVLIEDGSVVTEEPAAGPAPEVGRP